MISIMSVWQAIFEAAPDREIEAGRLLFRQEDPVHAMYLVRSGEVALERPMKDGTTLTLHVARAGMAVAEASLFARSYHCDGVVRERAVIAALSRAEVTRSLRETPEAALSLIETYAKEVQAQRARMEILRMRRVADKLDAWLDLYGAPEPGGWVRVAGEIGVSAPALYRNLARRRD